MNGAQSQVNRPNVSMNMFWEFRVDKIGWQQSYRTIVQRGLERESDEEWQELVRFYGWEKVVPTATREISYLPDDIIDEVSVFLNRKKEDFRCYHRKPFLPGHWI